MLGHQSGPAQFHEGKILRAWCPVGVSRQSDAAANWQALSRMT